MEEERIVSLEKLLAHRQWVARVARALVPGADADDLAQSVWLRAVTRPPRSDRGLRGWLATLLRRTARDTWRSESRRRDRERRATSSGAEPAADEVVTEAETHRRVVNAVMGLPEPYRSTVLLRWYEDLGPTEIAARQGVPLETVRTRLRRAHAELRRRLDEEQGGDGRTWALALLPLARAAAPGAGALIVSAKTKLIAVAAALVLLAALTPFLLPRAEKSPRENAIERAEAPAPPPPVEPAPEPEQAPPPPEEDAATPAPEVEEEDPAPAAPEGARIPVRVVDSTGRGIAKATVALLRWPPGESSGFGPWWLRVRSKPEEIAGETTGADGRAVMTGVASGYYSIRAVAEGRATRTEELSVREGLDPAEILLLLRPAHVLEGSVKRTDGTPISDVVVSTHPSAETTTDERGEFRLTSLPPGRCHLAVRLPSGTGLTVDLIDIPGVRRYEFVLDLSAAVEGRVVDDATGEPVPGARVQVGVSDGATFGSGVATTGPGGDYRIHDLLPGFVTAVQVRAEGRLPWSRSYLSGSRPLAKGRPFRQDVRLSRGGKVRGRVTIGPDEPASGALVMLYGRGWRGDLRVTAEEDGTFVFPAVTPGPATIRAVAEGCYQPGYDGTAAIWNHAECPAGLVVPANDEVVKDVVLVRGGTVEGVVLDPDRRPLLGVEVFVHPGGNDRGVTDGEGRFLMGGVHPGEGKVVIPCRGPGWSLREWAAAGKSEPFTVTAGEPVTGIEVVLRPGGILAGKVVDEDGRPVPGAGLWLVSPGQIARFAETWSLLPSAPVAADGSFRIEHIYADAVGLVASADGYGDASVPEIRLAPGETREGVELVLTRERRVSGRVVDEEGRAIAGAAIRIVRRRGEHAVRMLGPIRAVTGADGAFHVGGLSDAAYALTALRSGFADTSVAITGDVDDLVVTMTPGLAIAGVVVDRKTGAPIAGVVVEAEARYGDPALPHQSGRTRTDANGRFRLAGLRKGAYQLVVASASRGRPEDPPYASRRDLKVEAGVEDLRIELRRALDIAGRVTDEDGRPIAGVDVRIRGIVAFG
ncbi:MAG: sigma-70 family RNA polymerase sigma factor, partial [Planctomycetota bacterium]